MSTDALQSRSAIEMISHMLTYSNEFAQLRQQNRISKGDLHDDLESTVQPTCSDEFPIMGIYSSSLVTQGNDDKLGIIQSIKYPVQGTRLFDVTLQSNHNNSCDSSLTKEIYSVSVMERWQSEKEVLPTGARSLLVSVEPPSSTPYKSDVRLLFRGLNKFHSLEELNVLITGGCVASKQSDAVSLILSVAEERKCSNGNIDSTIHPPTIVLQRKLGGFVINLFSLDGAHLELMSKHVIHGKHTEIAWRILKKQIHDFLKLNAVVELDDDTSIIAEHIKKMAMILFKRGLTVICECIDTEEDSNHPILEDDPMADKKLHPFAVQRAHCLMEYALSSIEAEKFCVEELGLVGCFVKQDVFFANEGPPGVSAGIPSSLNGSSTITHLLSSFKDNFLDEVLRGDCAKWDRGNHEGFVLVIEAPSSLSHYCNPLRVKIKTFRYKVTRLVRSFLSGEMSTSSHFMCQPLLLQLLVVWLVWECSPHANKGAVSLLPTILNNNWRDLLDRYINALDMIPSPFRDKEHNLGYTWIDFAMRVSSHQMQVSHSFYSEQGVKEATHLHIVMLCGLPGSGKSTFAKRLKKVTYNSGIVVVHIEKDLLFANEISVIESGQETILSSSIIRQSGNKRGPSIVRPPLSNRQMRLTKKRTHHRMEQKCRDSVNICLGWLATPSQCGLLGSENRNNKMAVIIIDACNATAAARKYWFSLFPPSTQLSNDRLSPYSTITKNLVYFDTPFEVAKHRALRRTHHPVLGSQDTSSPSLHKVKRSSNHVNVPTADHHSILHSAAKVAKAVESVFKVFEPPQEGEPSLAMSGIRLFNISSFEERSSGDPVDDSSDRLIEAVLKQGSYSFSHLAATDSDKKSYCTIEDLYLQESFLPIALSLVEYLGKQQEKALLKSPLNELESALQCFQPLSKHMQEEARVKVKERNLIKLHFMNLLMGAFEVLLYRMSRYNIGTSITCASSDSHYGQSLIEVGRIAPRVAFCQIRLASHSTERPNVLDGICSDVMSILQSLASTGDCGKDATLLRGMTRWVNGSLFMNLFTLMRISDKPPPSKEEATSITGVLNPKIHPVKEGTIHCTVSFFDNRGIADLSIGREVEDDSDISLSTFLVSDQLSEAMKSAQNCWEEFKAHTVVGSLLNNSQDCIDEDCNKSSQGACLNLVPGEEVVVEVDGFVASPSVIALKVRSVLRPTSTGDEIIATTAATFYPFIPLGMGVRSEEEFLESSYKQSMLRHTPLHITIALREGEDPFHASVTLLEKCEALEKMNHIAAEERTRGASKDHSVTRKHTNFVEVAVRTPWRIHGVVFLGE